MKRALDRVLTSEPVDRTAAAVTKARGEHWEASLDGPNRMLCREMPFPVVDRAVTRTKLGNSPDFIEFSGSRFGRLIVLGLYDPDADGDHGDVIQSASTNASRGGRWVCRCACGWYQLLRAKAVKRHTSGDGADAMCGRCDYLQRVKQRQQTLPPRSFTS